VRLLADYSTEELEKIADKFRSDTSGIRGTKDFTSPEELYDELKKEIKKYHPSDDTSLVDKAYRVAYDAHKGQARKSGEPYIIHPLCVAIILAELELDKETIAAGLLHDVLEDTIITTANKSSTINTPKTKFVKAFLRKFKSVKALMIIVVDDMDNMAPKKILSRYVKCNNRPAP
jgi:hypothetical protein